MGLIVQKFGGSSVANAERVMNVASIVTDTYKEGNDVIVVVSAQGDTTDDLIAKAQEINPKASKREMDMLLSAGEQISISLLAMAIEKLGFPVVSLLGWQAGFNTYKNHTTARIKKIDTERVADEIDKHKIVVVAGFQGLNKYDDITTLGRGGSDTSAVALAAALHADKCQIYTDVEGVYTTDPRKVANAKIEDLEIQHHHITHTERRVGQPHFEIQSVNQIAHTARDNEHHGKAQEGTAFIRLEIENGKQRHQHARANDKQNLHPRRGVV